jgi:hypothetical protein
MLFDVLDGKYMVRSLCKDNPVDRDIVLLKLFIWFVQFAKLIR